jgi:GTP cyclohydrolase II
MIWDTENIIGKNYGAEHSDLYFLTEAKYFVDIAEASKKKTEDEFVDSDLQELIYYNSKHRENLWNTITTINPYGLWALHPSISCVRAKLDLRKEFRAIRDGIIVDSHGYICCLKIAMQYTWNIPALCKKLDITEMRFRKVFYEKTKNAEFLDTTKNVYLPHIPGVSIFAFGDLKKLKSPETEVTLRIHDACLNSDCFRGTICTCAPYLFWSIEKAVETAQRGGVGIIFYYKKEGRALGEVIKFRVYSAREGQLNGDSSETYFEKTKEIAGIEDIRFQELMPEPLLWLGITKIDNLYSMSHVKYDALIKAGIKVLHRYDLSESLIPKDAHVEIDAKIDSGYFSKKKK